MYSTITKNDQKTVGGIHQACLFVIDDEPIVTEIIKAYLADSGFENVHSFNDPTDAIESLMRLNADLIVTDVNMPGVGGNYLTRIAKQMEHNPGVPVVAFTADRSRDTELKLLDSGAIKVLHKPLDREQLVACVKEALGGKY